jgi:uncharacterized protein (DUF488 family)
LKRKLYSIGYTGFSVQEFISTLTDNGVECLIDTRELPISRKRGFAKTALQGHLLDAGLDYRHCRLLGSPRSDRHEVRVTGDYRKFFSAMRRHLASVEAASAIQDVIQIARTKASCLMCCCPDWRLCHRSCVVEAITNVTCFYVEHLERAEERVTVRKAA